MRNTFFKSLSKEFIIALFSACVALISLSLFFFPPQTKQIVVKKLPTQVKKVVLSPTPLKTDTKSETITNTQITPTEVPQSDESTQTQTIQITVVITPTPTQTSPSNKANISVSIDGISPFQVSLDTGKNQCEVLSQALTDKKISQLLMKYDSSLDSYGIYQINGLGKDNAVWWTYTVNGKSPTVGCNHIAANNGDTVSWKYVGSK